MKEKEMSEKISEKKLVDRIQAIRQQALKVDFEKMKQYAVSRHEDTIRTLMEVACDIEDTITDFWFTDGITLDAIGDNVMRNPLTGVRARYVQGVPSSGRVWVWYPGRVQFLLDVKNTKVKSILHRRTSVAEDSRRSDDVYRYDNFKFLNCGDERVPGGLERFLKSPTFECYFPGVKPTQLDEYKKILDQVDEDYNLAVKCRESLAIAKVEIVENGQKWLEEAEELIRRGTTSSSSKSSANKTNCKKENI